MESHSIYCTQQWTFSILIRKMISKNWYLTNNRLTGFPSSPRGPSMATCATPTFRKTSPISVFTGISWELSSFGPKGGVFTLLCSAISLEFLVPSWSPRFTKTTLTMKSWTWFTNFLRSTAKVIGKILSQSSSEVKWTLLLGKTHLITLKGTWWPFFRPITSLETRRREFQALLLTHFCLSLGGLPISWSKSLRLQRNVIKLKGTKKTL